MTGQEPQRSGVALANPSQRSLTDGVKVSPVKRIIDRAKRSLTIHYGESTVSDEHAPSPEQRLVLMNRLAVLDERTGGEADAGALAMVAGLRVLLPFQGKGDAEAEKMAGAFYRQALGDLPAGAIVRAVEKINRGEVKSRFMPTPAEMRAHVVAILEPYRAEAYEIRAILDAKVLGDLRPDAGTRAKQVADMAQRLFSGDPKKAMIAMGDITYKEVT